MQILMSLCLLSLVILIIWILLFCLRFGFLILSCSHISDFDSFACTREDNRSGGVLIFAKKNLGFSQFKLDLNPLSELILIYSSKLDLAVLAIYRSVSFNISDFNDDLEKRLSSLSFKSCILIGDLNINLLSEGSAVDGYLEILNSFGFVQHIDHPTRSGALSNSCIDHIFLRSEKDRIKISTGYCDVQITDHVPIIGSMNFRDLNLTLDTETDLANPKTIIDFPSLTFYLENYCFTTDKYTLENQYDDLVWKLNNIKYSFVKKILPTKKFRNPWMTEEFLKW